MSKLPDKASELIMLALSDLNTIRSTEGYKIDMENWHLPLGQSERTCYVCLAGSVMANTLKAGFKERMAPHYYPEDIADKLSSLDDFRQGWVYSGLLKLGVSTSVTAKRKGSDYYPVVPYWEDPEGFFRSMTDLANHLAMRGL